MCIRDSVKALRETLCRVCSRPARESADKGASGRSARERIKAAGSLAIEQHSREPVSYTHLDVYKRQQLNRAGERLNICNSTLLDIVVKLC